MTSQLNIRVSKEFLDDARRYSKKNGYLNVQEFIREAAREKLYNVREDYAKILVSEQANTYLSDKEADDFDKELDKKAKLK